MGARERVGGQVVEPVAGVLGLSLERPHLGESTDPFFIGGNISIGPSRTSDQLLVDGLQCVLYGHKLWVMLRVRSRKEVVMRQ